MLLAQVNALQKQNQDLKKLLIYTAALANPEVSHAASMTMHISTAKRCIIDGDWLSSDAYAELDGFVDSFNFEL